MSVKRIRDEKIRTQAAVASEQAATIYGLSLLQRDIANQKENFTRFMIVATEPVTYDTTINCKTSMIFATQHEKGALVRCLNALAREGLNLTKLESRPRPNAPWEYLFHVQAALTSIKEHTSYLKVLGSYPARTIEHARQVQRDAP
jgi:chorismate mutase/prephenate dehydratase